MRSADGFAGAAPSTATLDQSFSGAVRGCGEYKRNEADQVQRFHCETPINSSLAMQLYWTTRGKEDTLDLVSSEGAVSGFDLVAAHRRREAGT